MSFSLSKLFGNKTSETKLQSDDSIEAIINDVENNPFGVSQQNVLYAGLNELGGYYFFQTVIVGQLHVKSKNGAQLFFTGDNFELQLNADTAEFESESSDIKGRSVTKIDFEIEESDIEKLQDATLKNIQLQIRKYNILFTKHTFSDEEE